MDHATQRTFASFIWNIAGDVLRDFRVRGKYRGVILRYCVRLCCPDPS
jgi:hypothetical protein